MMAMGLWHRNAHGEAKPFVPSDYVWGDMDTEDAKAMLGRLLDVLWEHGKLTDAEVIEIIGYRELATSPDALPPK